MRSTFFGIEIARRALWANLRALDVTAHNVANANTPGYSRQVATLRATAPTGGGYPHAPAAGQVGTGVEVARIEHLRNQFIDQQIWSALAERERWSTRRRVFAQIEVSLQEPSDAGIGGAMDRFWDAMAELAANPESAAARNLVLERAQTVVATFQALDQQLAAIENELSDELTHQVAQVNRLAERIDALNQRIARIEGQGQRANDLRDERARLIEELSRLVDVRVRETERGTVRVTVAGVDLVGAAGARKLDLKYVTLPDGTVQPDVYWGDLQAPAGPVGGALGETLALLRDVVPEYRKDLRTMAETLSQEVNQLHAGGYGLDNQTGQPFFSLPAGGLADLSQWQVNPNLLADPNAIAAAKQPDAAGDGSNARDISGLRNERIFNNGTTTFDEYYRAWISRIGSASQEAQQMERNQDLLLTQLTEQREQDSGVSLDEEMAQMLVYRQAYNAAARVLTTVDEMLATLVSGTGVVGR